MSRADYCVFRKIATRWMDNDAYGHVNNVVYGSWIDTAVNTWLVEQGLLHIAGGKLIGLVVESGCRYDRSVAFPQAVESGLRIARLGNSSVRWEVGIFTDDVAAPAAEGFFVHVYVDRETRRPVPLPDNWRTALGALVPAAGFSTGVGVAG